MISKVLKYQYLKFICLLLVSLLPFAAFSTTEEVISEKRMAVAMRMIGHEVLLCLGDSESRVLPIEKIDEYYKISFEFEFGFDPDDIAGIVDEVMMETGVAINYLVEMKNCETQAVVHSFEIRNGNSADAMACAGRVLPKDCYYILFTNLDDAALAYQESDSNDSSLTPSKDAESSLFKPVLLLIPFLFLIGFIGYFRKRKPEESDPDLVLIGASRFDKRNMALSFADNKVELSNKEGELLSLLHTSANLPVEREVLLKRVWGDEGDYVGRTLDVFISKLRKKLEADTSVKIVNIRGVGYKLVMNSPG